ncbi:O-fucosyltransferase family protein [Paracoccus binzhouensis]|uniref:hypothetical protein n=1 Tax=Paracoccus binzhouensis TaxID=2796149 RepID=UPI0018EEE45E|nr:hypothetical protein [Paracoccus binzhouensis]
MTEDVSIIGFRQDRIGARLICLLNVMRLARRFGVKGRYLWLSEPGGPYPELVDPRDFLSADFVAEHIAVVEAPPQRAGLQNLRAVAPGMNRAGFAKALAEGRRYECDAMSEVVCFMDEKPAELAAEIRAVARQLTLSERLCRALEDARRIVAGAGGGRPIAIHVRRGDILDGDPWSYSSWSSKYVPDEFFRAFISGSQGPVIAFSDTPAAIAHLRQGDPRLLAGDDLLDAGALSPAERDLLELLLMAGCAKVGAPSHSAFSRAAALLGGCRIVALPNDLPGGLRLQAYDALLARVIDRPDSFFAPGDLAQSASYAARHAMTSGRGSALVDALAPCEALLERFPFLYRELAVAAWAAGRVQKARKLARRGLDSPLIRNRDKPPCRQVLLMTEAQAGGTGIDAAFLGMILTGRAAEGPIMPVLAHRLVAQGSAAARVLLFPPALLGACARPDPLGGKAEALPLWALRIDWSEFVRNPALQGEMLLWPDMWRKLAPAAAGLAEIEAALAAGGRPELPGGDGAARLGFCAAILRLHGRLKRAFALLHWLDEAQPGQALTRKRLADGCFAAGNRKAGHRWLDAALELAPGNAMLLLSQALRAAEEGDDARVAALAQVAAEAWPELRLEQAIRQARRGGMPAGR